MFRIIELIHFQTNIVKKNLKMHFYKKKNWKFFFTILVWKWIKSMILNTFYSIELFHKMTSSMCFLALNIDVLWSFKIELLPEFLSDHHQILQAYLLLEIKQNCVNNFLIFLKIDFWRIFLIKNIFWKNSKILKK